ncbi:hypothetical protein AB8L61_08880 [Clostridioides difficile]|nr:hypothetical protein [Clostridioides difficile]
MEIIKRKKKHDDMYHCAFLVVYREAFKYINFAYMNWSLSNVL